MRLRDPPRGTPLTLLGNTVLLQLRRSSSRAPSMATSQAPSSSGGELPWGVLLKADALDWAAVVALIVTGASVEAAPPYRHVLFPDELWRLSLPHTANTVPSWTVPVVALAVPTAVIAALHSTRRSFDRRTAARLTLCLFGACSMTFAITNVLKVAVGRPRPDFVARCWPDGQVTGLPGVPVCEGDQNAHVVKEGLKSFPSGHTSLTMCGMTYLSLLLWTRVLFVPSAAVRGPVLRVLAAALPLLYALYVAVSRVRDGWHHWSDCAAGALLGGGLAWLFASIQGKDDPGAVRQLRGDTPEDSAELLLNAAV